MKNSSADVRRILVVEDEPVISAVCQRVLTDEGFEVDTAINGKVAQDMIVKKRYDLFLIDIRMPEMDGEELYQWLQEKDPQIASRVIFTTGSVLGKDTEAFIEQTGRPFLPKPFTPDELKAVVRETLKRWENELKNQELIDNITKAIALTTAMRDPYTSGHQQRVTQLACAIAEEMGLNKEMLAEIRVAGSLHDIGKMYIPSEILAKPGKLTDTEFDMIKTHSKVGYDILKTIDFPWPIAPIVLQHHERADGSGYPSGISAEDILLEARILAVADVVEAMSSHRPYRPALGRDKALEEISQKKGTLYDPEVVDACLKLFKEKGFKFE